MTQDVVTFRNGRIFDGTTLWEGRALRFENERLAAFKPDAEISDAGHVVDLGEDIVSPGYVDLQVNGGGGVLFNDDPSVKTLGKIAQTHRSLGVKSILPTLITDSPDKTHAAIDAAITALKAGVTGIAGLHLEGPHLSVARKGAHDADLIRPMEQRDLDILLSAAAALPCLKVTVAPESVSEQQVRALSDAGVLVSLGHTDAGFDTCMRYFAAGARCATHLFNAMSQLGNREPGLVGAVLANGAASSGLIADMVHVHPEAIRMAWAAKRGPGRLYLVSDAMAVAGTDKTEFQLNGRTILRRDGILTLADGTLAGADLDLTTAVSTMVKKIGISLEEALHAATTVPAALIGKRSDGVQTGNAQMTDLIRVSADFSKVSTLGR